jgi:hypothetical protein
MRRYKAIISWYDFQKIQKLNLIIATQRQSGGCRLCGSSNRLEFHHVDFKRFNIGDFSSPTITIKQLRRELRQCVILCHDCHTELHKQIEATKC